MLVIQALQEAHQVAPHLEAQAQLQSAACSPGAVSLAVQTTRLPHTSKRGHSSNESHAHWADDTAGAAVPKAQCRAAHRRRFRGPQQLTVAVRRARCLQGIAKGALIVSQPCKKPHVGKLPCRGALKLATQPCRLADVCTSFLHLPDGRPPGGSSTASSARAHRTWTAQSPGQTSPPLQAHQV